MRPPIQESLERPPFETPLTQLKADIAASLKQQLDSLQKLETVADEHVGAEPPIGTSCKNGACKAVSLNI